MMSNCIANCNHWQLCVHWSRSNVCIGSSLRISSVVSLWCNVSSKGGGFNHRITAMCLHYPVCMHKGVKQSVLSVCRSVSLSVQWKINNVCVPDRDQSSSLLCISSSFLFNIGIVHHFDTVNHLDMVKTGYVLTPSTCSRSPASLFPGWWKAGQGPGNEATHSSGRTGEWNMACY